MTAILVTIPLICYGIASAMYASRADWSLAIVYAGYAAANVGLLMLDLSRQ